MSRTMTVRINDQVRERLVDAARAMVLKPATLAAKLIGDGLSRPQAVPEDGPLVLAVREEFAGNGHSPDPVRAALALLLARQVESGSSAGAERLLTLLQRRVEAVAGDLEREHREFAEYLGVPVHTFCEGCRGEMVSPEGRLLAPGELPGTRRDMLR
jgi:hypothetical protein